MMRNDTRKEQAVDSWPSERHSYLQTHNNILYMSCTARKTSLAYGLTILVLE